MKDKIYIIVGYKPANEPYGPQDSHIFGFCNTKKEANQNKKILNNKYIPKRLKYADVDMIGWRYNNNIEDYIMGNKYNPEVAEIVRSDWEKWGGSRQKLEYEGFSIEEIEKITDINNI